MSGEARFVGSLSEKLLTEIYFWLYNERWTETGLAGSAVEYMGKRERWGKWREDR